MAVTSGRTIKIDCDGAKNPSDASAGFVIRSWNGSFILAGARFLKQAPILVAEVTAVRDGLKTALEAGYRRNKVEGDNQVVIRVIQARATPPWQIAIIIEDIRNLIEGCEDISFKHIYREGNMVANWVAKYVCTIRSTSLSYFPYPSSRDFLYILADD